MTLQEIIIKITLFFGIFYGAIMITSLITKRFKPKEDATEETESKKEDKE